MPEVLTILVGIFGAFAAVVLLAYIGIRLSEGSDAEGPES